MTCLRLGTFALVMGALATPAACSAGHPRDAAGPPVSAAPAAATISGVAIVPDLLKDAVDLNTADDAPDVLAQQSALPSEAIVLRVRGRTVIIAASHYVGDAPIRETSLEVRGHAALFGEPSRNGLGCRPTLSVDLGSGTLVDVAGDGASRGDLRDIAARVTFDDGHLLVDRPAGSSVVGTLPEGWAATPHASVVRYLHGERADIALVVPLTGAQRAAFDGLLCRSLLPVKTGISGTQLVDLRSFEHHAINIDGERVTIGMLDKRTPVAISSHATSPAVVLLEHDMLQPNGLPTDLTSRRLAEYGAEAEVEPEPRFAAHREQVVDREIERGMGRLRSEFRRSQISILASGRDGDLAWLLTGVWGPIASRTAFPYACVWVPRSWAHAAPDAFAPYDNGGYPSPGSAVGVSGGGDVPCFSAGRAPGPLAPGVHADFGGVVDFVWGVADVVVDAVDVRLPGRDPRRVTTVPVGLSGIDRVFVADLPGLSTRADDTGGYWKRVLDSDPVVLEAIGADGQMLARLEWGSPSCPIDLPEHCRREP